MCGRNPDNCPARQKTSVSSAPKRRRPPSYSDPRDSSHGRGAIPPSPIHQCVSSGSPSILPSRISRGQLLLAGWAPANPPHERINSSHTCCAPQRPGAPIERRVLLERVVMWECDARRSGRVQGVQGGEVQGAREVQGPRSSRAAAADAAAAAAAGRKPRADGGGGMGLGGLEGGARVFR